MNGAPIKSNPFATMKLKEKKAKPVRYQRNDNGKAVNLYVKQAFMSEFTPLNE